VSRSRYHSANGLTTAARIDIGCPLRTSRERSYPSGRMWRAHGPGGGSDNVRRATVEPPGPVVVRLQLCRLEHLPGEGPRVPRPEAQTPETALPGHRAPDRSR